LTLSFQQHQIIEFAAVRASQARAKRQVRLTGTNTCHEQQCSAAQQHQTRLVLHQHSQLQHAVQHQTQQHQHFAILNSPKHALSGCCQACCGLTAQHTNNKAKAKTKANRNDPLGCLEITS
jgi:hypothetical protein